MSVITLNISGTLLAMLQESSSTLEMVYDEYGPIHIAMKKVYDNDFGKRVATCAFHFLQSLQRHAEKLNSDEREELHKLGKKVV